MAYSIGSVKLTGAIGTRAHQLMIWYLIPGCLESESCNPDDIGDKRVVTRGTWIRNRRLRYIKVIDSKFETSQRFSLNWDSKIKIMTLVKGATSTIWIVNRFFGWYLAMLKAAL